MTGDYVITFNINGIPRRMPTPDHEPWTLDDIRHGFWIRADMRPCRESQGAMWIPPSQLILIERAMTQGEPA